MLLVDSVRIVRGGALSHIVADRLRVFPGDCNAWMATHTRILKEDTYGLVSVLDAHDAQGVLKLYGFRSRMHALGYTFGRGRALHSHKAANILRREGISVPEPMGVLRVPEGMLLLSEAIPGQGNLLQVWHAEPSADEAARILQVAGHTLGHLHTTGFAHGDCKWNNFLWDGQGISLVDLDAVTKSELLSPRQARDVARFTVNAESIGVVAPLYNQFLESYLQVIGSTRQQVVEAMVPFVYSIRAKYLARYGPHGQRLV